MGFINPGKNSRSRIAGVRPRDRPSTPPSRGPRCSSPIRHHRTKRSRTGSRLSSTPLSSRDPSPLPVLSRFESLPVEILHNVFAHSFNLNLARASLHLTHTFAARNLQLEYVRVHSNDHDALSNVFTLRFFTLPFLELWETRFGQMLNCTWTVIPMKLISEPWSEENMGLLAALVARGAELLDDERDGYLSVLHSALAVRRKDVVRFLVESAGLKPDTQSLRLAVRHTVGEEGDLEVCRMLVGRGADVGDVGVWREALGLDRRNGGEKAVGWLLEEAAPPGEVLGELSSR